MPNIQRALLSGGCLTVVCERYKFKTGPRPGLRGRHIMQQNRQNSGNDVMLVQMSIRYNDAVTRSAFILELEISGKNQYIFIYELN